MGNIAGLIEGRDVTSAQLAEYDKVAEQINQQPRDNGFNPSQDNHRLFFVAFDGTSSDREKRGDYHTNPDILEQMVEKSERVSSVYVHGVGTRSLTGIHSLVEMVTGNGTEQRAELAYRSLVGAVQDWHQSNPNMEPHIVTSGFSRGVGSQRHFANLVEDHGIANKECTGFLIEPGQVKQDLMLMFDGVITGQERTLDMPIPQSVMSSVHLVAADEKREFFDSASIIDPLYPDREGRLEAELPGRHVDVGGDYDYGGLSARALELGVYAMQRNGIPLTELPEHYQSQANDVSMGANNQLLPFNWESEHRDIDQYSDTRPGPQLDTARALGDGCTLGSS